MSQLTLGYSEPQQGKAVWREALDWARRLVDSVGAKTVAFELDVSASWLADALNERAHGDGKKGIKGEHLMQLAMMAPHGMRHEFVSIICPALGFEVPEVRKVRTPEERLAELERLVAEKFGEFGARLVEEVRR